MSLASHANETDRILVPAKTVARMLGVSERTIWRMVSAGKLMSPIKVSGNTRWRRQEIEDWISSGCPEMGEGRN